ncbi:MAG TPA: vWA domain-containing protein [Luteolibacter sp.]|nr:vWA domain-containing protein [Luteolibacter sp.]
MKPNIKHHMLRGLLLGSITLVPLTAAVRAAEEAAIKPIAESAPAKGQAKVQLAILLDTSGSMSGLIEQAKTQLWQIVNTFIDAKQNGQVPFVEVALYEYGNDGLNSETHWIRQITPLTRDLDLVSKELFSLRTNGGSEFCGAVVQRATVDLKWDTSPDVYKAIFVAGNEPFTQGPIEPNKACREAVAKGVIVNTIHCGGEQEGINSGWKDGAVLADGKFLIIDHNQAVVHIEAPQDAEIVKLNEALNKTYIPFGAEGQKRCEEQVAQDANAAAAPTASGANVQRALSKASCNYWNANWDLVDASKEKDFKWEALKDEQLPEEMRKLDAEGRRKYVTERKTQRDEIAGKIQELNKQRQEFVTAKLKEAGEGKDNTLDKVMAGTVREQAAKKGYQFGK